MELKHLIYKECPDCGAIITTTEKRKQHTNGRCNEKLIFECGAVLSWSPNSKKEVISTPCPNSKQQIAIKDKRIKASNAIHKFISSLDVDDEYKTHLILQVRGSVY
jgi:hypothetical protein